MSEKLPSFRVITLTEAPSTHLSRLPPHEERADQVRKNFPTTVAEEDLSYPLFHIFQGKNGGAVHAQYTALYRPGGHMVRMQWLLISLVGVGIAVLVRDTLLSFIDLPSLVITLGGTLAVTCFSYSWETLKGLGVTIRTVLAKEANSPEKQITLITQLAQLYHVGGLRALESREAALQDPLLQRAVGMIVDMRREDEVRTVVEHEFFLLANRYEAARQVLLTMGKLFPSFGMVGTLIGLVLLLRQAADPDPQTLAPALAVAVLTTLYGAVFSNALVLPLAAKLQAFIQDREQVMRLTVEGVMLITRSQSPVIVQKRLASLLTRGELLGHDQRTVPRAPSRLALFHR
jgi:chemotaxis protein MotA